MVLEPDTGPCASEDAGPPMGVDYEIPCWLERRMKHGLLGCGSLSLKISFKTLRGSPKEKAQRGQYLPVVSLDGYKYY